MAGDTLLTLVAGTQGIHPMEVTEGSDTRKWDSFRQIMLMIKLETQY
jgi:hypothetical protein